MSSFSILDGQANVPVLFVACVTSLQEFIHERSLYRNPMFKTHFLNLHKVNKEINILCKKKFPYIFLSS